jgi:hypothetical protein
MDGAIDQPEALIWTSGQRVPLVEAVCKRVSGVRVLAVGGPRRAEVSELSERLHTDAADDLRQLIVDRPASFLLLATTAAVSRGDVRQALEQGIDVLMLEPFAAHPDQVLNFEPGKAPPGRLVQTPMLRLAPGYLAAAEPEQVLGKVGSLSITAVSAPDAGSLFAHLADAMDLVVHLLDVPDMIGATLTTNLPAPPDDLRGLTGDLTANLSFGDEAAAAIHVSDRAAVWRRAMVAVGEAATLLVDDLSYRLVGGDPQHIDEAPAERHPEPADLIAGQWQWLMQHRAGPAAVNRRAVIACCETALLSCRTGQPESPETFLQMPA